MAALSTLPRDITDGAVPRRETYHPSGRLTAGDTPIGGAYHVSFDAVDISTDGRLVVAATTPASPTPFDGSVRLERVRADVFAIAHGRVHVLAA